jgi:hypothetical protein
MRLNIIRQYPSHQMTQTKRHDIKRWLYYHYSLVQNDIKP